MEVVRKRITDGVTGAGAGSAVRNAENIDKPTGSVRHPSSARDRAKPRHVRKSKGRKRTARDTAKRNLWFTRKKIEGLETVLERRSQASQEAATASPDAFNASPLPNRSPEQTAILERFPHATFKVEGGETHVLIDSGSQWCTAAWLRQNPYWK